MTEMTLHPAQSLVFKDIFMDKVASNYVAVTSRGFGKSHLAAVCGLNACAELWSMPASVPNKNVYIIAPTFDQVVDIYHPLIVHQLGMEEYCIKHSRDSGRIWFPNNVQLRLVSYEAIERMRGKGAYFVVLDEVSSWTKGVGFKEAWESIIQPCITTRWSPQTARLYNAPSAGRSLTISTPKGYNFLYDMFHFQESTDDFKSYHFDYTQSPLLDVDEIEKVKDTIDPIKFAREYKASFEDSGMNVFYTFDRKVHVVKDLLPFTKADSTKGELGEEVHICIDFNVGIMAASVFALRGGQMHFLDEFKGQPDTEQLAIAIRGRYPIKYFPRIYLYPDPTGRARKTSAAVGVTDFSILSDPKHKLIIRARSSSPPIVDSVNAVNRQLKTAAGVVRMYFHPKCKGTIVSVERTSWVDRNLDTATIDKKEGIEHFSDGIRYATEFLFPITNHTKTTAMGKSF